MHRPIQTDFYQFQSSTLSCTCRSPHLRAQTADNQRPVLLSFTPKIVPAAFSKWHIRGHKFSTIHTNKKPKPTFESFFTTPGFPFSQKRNSKQQPKLLTSQIQKIRPKSQNNTRTGSIYLPPGSTFVSKRKNSSKNLQVDYHDIEEWIQQ